VRNVILVTSQVQQQDKQCFKVCVNMPDAGGLNCLFSSHSFSLRGLAYSFSTIHSSQVILCEECGQHGPRRRDCSCRNHRWSCGM